MQTKIILHAISAGVCLAALSGTAVAQPAPYAYANVPVDVYAGPAPDYPLVAQLPAGFQLTVMGCLDDYSWCDVAAPGLRGWVYGAYLSYPYDGATVPVMTYGIQLGLPIVAFSIGPYWSNYYRGRPWYHDQARWASHPPPIGRTPPPYRGPPPAGAAVHPYAPPPGGGAPHPYGPPPSSYHGGPPPGQPVYGHAPGPEPARPVGGQPGPMVGRPAGPAPQHGGEERGGEDNRQSNH
jgi:uncharacterized protein YraI